MKILPFLSVVLSLQVLHAKPSADSSGNEAEQQVSGPDESLLDLSPGLEQFLEVLPYLEGLRVAVFDPTSSDTTDDDDAFDGALHDDELHSASDEGLDGDEVGEDSSPSPPDKDKQSPAEKDKQSPADAGRTSRK